jgi:hypothetical protein
MVSSIYTPNKRIGYYRDLSRALMPKQISAYNPNIRNPYAQTAGTNLANVLSGLVNTYSAEQQLGKAEQLEAAQSAAQDKIYARLGQMRAPGVGPTLDAQGGQFKRVPYRRRALDISPETLKTAGTTKQAIAGDVASINKAARAAYDKSQNAAIDAAIVQAYQDNNEEAVAALRLLRDPMKATKPEKLGKPVFTAFGGPEAQPGEGVHSYPDGSLVIWRRNTDGELISQQVPSPTGKKETDAQVITGGPAVGDIVEGKRKDEFTSTAERTAKVKLIEKQAALRAKVAETWPQLVAKRKKLQNETKEVLTAAEEAIKLIASSSRVTGVAGWALKDLPETDARTLRNILRKLAAYAGFSTLAEMRDTAPSGASGLGALSTQEMELLVASKFTGDQEMEGAALIKAIKDLARRASATLAIGEDMHNNIASTFGLTVDQKPAVASERVPQTEVDKLLQKYSKQKK